MPTNLEKDLADLLQQAMDGIDEQIAKLETQRAQLAALVGRTAGNASAIESLLPRKRRKFSAETKAKLKAAAKARWARVRAEKAKALKAKANTKTAAKKTKANPAPAKKAPAKKAKAAVKAVSKQVPTTENA
jgi:hypothetical protein